MFLKLLWKIWPISVKLWKPVWIRAWNYISTIYPASELELKDTSTSTTELCYLDARIKLGDKNSPSNVSIYDNRGDFAFRILNFPHMDSNSPTKPAYGVYVSTGELW